MFVEKKTTKRRQFRLAVLLGENKLNILFNIRSTQGNPLRIFLCEICLCVVCVFQMVPNAHILYISWSSPMMIKTSFNTRRLSARWCQKLFLMEPFFYAMQDDEAMKLMSHAYSRHVIQMTFIISMQASYLFSLSSRSSIYTWNE